jgi:hypothetical protein
MKKFLMILMALALPVMGQALVWEVDAAALLPGAHVDKTVVRADVSGRAWVILQNDTTAKLVRVGTKGDTFTWDLPDSDYVYGFRSLGPSSCVVQAGAKMTRVSNSTKQERAGNTKTWVQNNVVLTERADLVGYEDLPDLGTGKFFWYLVRGKEDGENGAATNNVSKLVLRRNP